MRSSTASSTAAPTGSPRSGLDHTYPERAASEASGELIGLRTDTRILRGAGSNADDGNIMLALLLANPTTSGDSGIFPVAPSGIGEHRSGSANIEANSMTPCSQMYVDLLQDPAASEIPSASLHDDGTVLVSSASPHDNDTTQASSATMHDDDTIQQAGDPLWPRRSVDGHCLRACHSCGRHCSHPQSPCSPEAPSRRRQQGKKEDQSGSESEAPVLVPPSGRTAGGRWFARFSAFCRSVVADVRDSKPVNLQHSLRRRPPGLTVAPSSKDTNETTLARSIAQTWPPVAQFSDVSTRPSAAWLRASSFIAMLLTALAVISLVHLSSYSEAPLKTRGIRIGTLSVEHGRTDTHTTWRWNPQAEQGQSSADIRCSVTLTELLPPPTHGAYHHSHLYQRRDGLPDSNISNEAVWQQENRRQSDIRSTTGWIRAPFWAIGQRRSSTPILRRFSNNCPPTPNRPGGADTTSSA